ncbi:MAG: LCP family protein [Candidatus Eremiobacteraeota bacterium]|nr:LCP family protein [Candidatus Eremiobacteraeota bacterium]
MRANSIVGRTVIALAAIVALLAGAVFAQAIIERRSPRDVMAGYFVPSPEALFHKDRIALLLLGIDYDYNSKDEQYSSSARTDTIMAASIEFPSSSDPTGHVAILSVPRDTDVVLPNGREDKINAAYAAGGSPLGDARASEKVVSGFLGLPSFDRFVTLRVDAAKELVDAIGGIDVVPDETMNYDDTWGHLHIHFIGGRTYHMNGDQAVSYSRFRHDECSDPCRIKRQQQVIRIVLAKLQNDKFHDLLHLNTLVDIIHRNVYTDLSQQEILSMALAFEHFDRQDLMTNQVPYDDTKDLACCGNVLIADNAAKTQLVQKFFVDSLAPPPAPAAVAAVIPSSVHVVVENGSGVVGEGARAAQALRKAGFVVDGVVNADSFRYDATEIHVHPAATLAGERVLAALALRDASVQAEPAAAQSGAVTVIVGRDFAAGDPPKIAPSKQ